MEKNTKLKLEKLDENFCYKLLKKHSNNQKTYDTILDHSIKVKNKALEIANNNLEKKPNLKEIQIGALLHDIGIFKINKKDYIKHSRIGYEILKKEQLPDKICKITKHHTGVGLTKEDIKKQNLDLPLEDLIPQTTEEEIVCLADKFYSKNQNNKEKTIQEIQKQMSKHGEEIVKRLNKLLKKYKIL